MLGGNVKGEITALGDTPDAQEIQRLKDEWQQRHESSIIGEGVLVVPERHESRRIDNQLRGPFRATRRYGFPVAFISRLKMD
ncbi:MAG: hypothetical protein R3E08_04585 [Thiotrichaceae bacterium]